MLPILGNATSGGFIVFAVAPSKEPRQVRTELLLDLVTAYFMSSKSHLKIACVNAPLFFVHHLRWNAVIVKQVGQCNKHFTSVTYDLSNNIEVKLQCQPNHMTSSSLQISPQNVNISKKIS